MFDYVFVTHLPSFYKTNLYNELSKKLKIHVIFIGKSSVIRTNDFTSGEISFSYSHLFDSDFEKRNILKSLFKLSSVLRKIKFKKIVVGGWDLIEFWFIVFFIRKNKNSLALESGIENSGVIGVKGIIKKIFLTRISIVFASGLSQEKLLKKLNYSKNIFITKGVGIINKVKFQKRDRVFSGNFLYLGRLSEEKNLKMLVNVFNELHHFKLNIVGSGPLEFELKNLAHKNINFICHVKNKNISEVFLNNDVFILPSISEPWGLVVEEAIYFGLPVIVSDQVGCAFELVGDKKNGIIFDFSSRESLRGAIMKMASNYLSYKNREIEVYINKKDIEQVNSYLKASHIN